MKLLEKSESTNRPNLYGQGGTNAFQITRDGIANELLSIRDVSKLLKCHRCTVWRKTKAGHLPAPIMFSGAPHWLLSEIDASVKNAKAKRDADQTEPARIANLSG